MKTLLAVLATIILGVFLYILITGENNSIRSEAARIFDNTVQQLQTIGD